MSFNWFSLDYIYYPVSGIMWLWYKLFGLVFGAENFFAWALSVMFLVFTLRAILYRPFVRQIETTRQMQELQPQIKELQKKYGKDRQRLALEMQKLQSEHGFNPLLGCLPMLAQIPVFLGLFHVLRSFNRTQGGFGQTQLTIEQNRTIGNYFFSGTDVSHFLNTDLFGAPLGATMIQSGNSLKAFANFDRPSVIMVGIPLMIISGIATHMNSRASVARQSPEAASNPQTALMNKLALYVFPLGVVVSGPFLPLAILVYWVANNIWTYGQQHVVFGRIEKREAEEKEQTLARRAANAPAPGVKPNRAKKSSAAAGKESAGTDAEASDKDGSTAAEDGAGSSAASKPAPGAKPNKKRR
ncbi:MAG: membrane protein insertase YidC [Mycobacterium sp.]|nr:membrane protein insertase YidC [Mycobacterium sp.]